MQIIYLLDKETLKRLLDLRRKLAEEQEYYNVTELMKHDSYRRVGRRIKQVKWGK